MLNQGETDSFGYWVRRRRKALDLTQAALASQVGCATITIKKIERDERRPSLTMAERLADFLIIKPAEREFFISTALGEAPIINVPISTEPIAPYTHDPTLSKPSKPVPSVWERFVGREHELTWLDKQVQASLQGEGKIVFIAGDAGRGKTALMTEFVRRAIHANPDIIVCSGICSAYAGIGDPYLPFREVLSFLTGETEVNRTPGAQYPENIRRVRQALPLILQTLVEHAPNLIEVLVPEKALLSRARKIAPGGARWMAQLQAEVAQRLKALSSPEQNTIFGQFGNFLLHLASHRPILITLDDLHWADDASLGLLFHLARRLSGSRILILATYRHEELATNQNDKRNLLANILSELKRTYGDVFLDLAAADQTGGKDFVDAYLNTLPNSFTKAFRQALYQRTRGHPLFTVEFLLEMQARGDLTLDSTGQWREAQKLDWDTLPARVEAVIAQRLNRLETSFIDILTVAGIEGEQFTAEVVARVLNIPERTLLQQLSQDLGKRHRLIQARGEIKLPHRVLSPYTFRHSLFQLYICDQLDPGEYRRLHSEVAGALEAIYQDEVETIAPKLAWHYQEAQLPHRAVGFLEMAGKKAIHLSGFEEAINLLNRGLSLSNSLPTTPEQIQHQIEMYLSLGEAYHRSGQLVEALETFQKAAALARKIGAPQELARAALGYEETRWRFNFPAEPARSLLDEARNLFEDDNILRVRLTVGLVRTLKPTVSQEQFNLMSQQALEMARRFNDPLTLYDALYLKIWGDRRPEHSSERMDAMNEMLELAESVSDMPKQLDTIGFRILENLELGDIYAVQADCVSQRRLMEKVQQPFYDYVTQLTQSTLAIMAGDFEEAERVAIKALATGRQMKVGNADGMFGIQMFTIQREQGRLREIAPLVKLFVEQHAQPGTWRPGLALIYSELGMKLEALHEFESLAAKDFEDIPNDSLWLTCIVYLSEVCAYLGDVDRAAYLYQLLLPHAGRSLVTGFSGVCYGAISRYLGLLAATMSRWSDAERRFQEALDLNSRLGAKPWLAHTQHLYGIMLLRRGDPKDRSRATAFLDNALETAHQLGMKSLEEKVFSSRHLVAP